MKKILEDVPLVKHLSLKLNEFKITHDPLDKVIEGLQKVTDITNMIAPGQEPPSAPADDGRAASPPPASSTPTVTEPTVEKGETVHGDVSGAPSTAKFVQLNAIDDNPQELENFAMVPPNAYGYDVPLDMRLVQLDSVNDDP
jgi:hypothetical protein